MWRQYGDSTASPVGVRSCESVDGLTRVATFIAPTDFGNGTGVRDRGGRPNDRDTEGTPSRASRSQL